LTRRRVAVVRETPSAEDGFEMEPEGSIAGVVVAALCKL
jgi:hypothetical protein